jgi:serine/threonine protein kinase
MESASTSDPPFVGDFFKERKLGSGAFGTVDLWRNKKTNQCVAIKRMHSDKGEHIARWQNEIDLLSNKVRHPNIVAVQLVGSKLLEELQNLHPRKVAALALEYCELGDLRRALHRPENCNGFVELEVRSILRSLSAAIAYLHDLTIIHRDLKPENIVMKRIGDNVVYKVSILGLDFRAFKSNP